MLLSCQQCRQFDQIAIEEYGIPGIVLMENAGAGCVRVLKDRNIARRASILCGGGNNGGDGYVIARHLLNAGVPAEVLLLSNPERLSGDAKINFDILQRMDTSIRVVDAHWTVEQFESALKAVGENPLVIDAMLGTGVKGPLREPFANAVAASNRIHATRFAIDIPTGLNGDTGACEVAFQADITCTFVAVKTGFENPDAKRWLGELEVIDIGAPKEILDRILNPHRA